MANFARTLAKRNKLVPHLDAWFDRAEFPDQIPFVVEPNKEHDDAFHPSSDAMECLRTLYFTHRGEIPRWEPDGTLRKIFMVGHYYHAMIQHILVDLGFATEEDIEKEHDEYRTTAAGNPYRMRGFTDVAECKIPGVGSYLIDIKTVNSFQFNQDKLSDENMAKYEVQGQLYMDWHDQDDMILLCAQKDSPHAFKEFYFKRDRGIAEAVYERWEVLADALAEEEPPDCDCIDPSKCPVDALALA